MARKGWRRRSGRRQRRRRRQTFHVYNIEKALDDSLEYEEKKRKHKRHLDDVASREREVLNRTVYVKQAKDLNDPANWSKFQRYFADTYGPVERCVKNESPRTRKRTHFPTARVTFRHASDANKIFGKRLQDVRKDSPRTVIETKTPVGYRGCLKIQPADIIRSRVHEDAEAHCLSFEALNVSMGHWITACDDAASCFKLEGIDETAEFLEEFAGFTGAKVLLDLRRRTLQLRVEATYYPECLFEGILTSVIEQYYTITLRLKDLRGSLDFCREKSEGGQPDSYSLVFSSIDPPKLRKVTITVGPYGFNFERVERLTSIPSWSAPFDRCLGFRLHLSQSTASRVISTSNKISRQLRDFGIVRKEVEELQDAVSLSSRRVDFNSPFVHEGLTKTCEEWIKTYLSRQNVPSRKVGLLVRSMLDRGKVYWYDALHDNVLLHRREYNIFQIVAGANDRDARAALEQMCEMHKGTRYPAKVIRHLLVNEEGPETEQTGSNRNIPDYCIELPRLVITPTRILVRGFDVEMSNRVVRNFVKAENMLAPEDFIRVSFADEDESPLFSNDFAGGEVGEKIRGVALQGLEINGYGYKFLAYSSSQLKELSFWMVSCSDLKKDSIRRWMGDFSAIKHPAKHAARMGQCFSTTIQTIPGISQGRFRYGLGQSSLRVNESFSDVLVDGNKEVCHSDGTGLIRVEKMGDVLKNVPFCPREVEDVSIIQIRFGGAKGTLTAWDFKKLSRITSLPRLTSTDVCLRTSMVKFPAPYRHLEIIGVGKHLPYYLNRQMVMLLDVHNVPLKSFLNLQNTMIDDLDAMIQDRRKIVEMLPRLSGPDSSITASLIHIARSGFSPVDEPFLFSCLHAIRSHHLTNLRKKARIHVPKGAVLVGGLDETRKVPEGCVFVQMRENGPLSSHAVVQQRDSNPFKVLKGPVLVAKHPVMHPGDVRMLWAVDIPELRRQKNVLLFSQHGMRPEADKMAGSDLDGDQFAVTWDESLFLSEWNGCIKLREGRYRSMGRIMDDTSLYSVNHTPMDFDAQKKPEPVAEVKDMHLIEHFINHAKADTLGTISMMWLDYASLRGTASCNECIRLAELHSIAVDFPKSGVPAEIPQHLRIPQSSPRPHWREVKRCESYHCESSVGKLYDSVVRRAEKRNFEGFCAMAGRRWNKQGQLLCFTQTKNGEEALRSYLNSTYRSHVPDKLGLFCCSSKQELDSEKLQDDSFHCILYAAEQREDYEDELISLMNKYKIHSEGELLTGCIRKYHRLSKRKQHALSEEVRRQCTQLRSSFRQSFLLEVAEKVCHSNLRHDLESRERNPDIDVKNTFAWIEAAAEGCWKQATVHKRLPGNKDYFTACEMEAMHRYSLKLAAAYYVITYCPHMRWLDVEEVEEKSTLESTLARLKSKFSTHVFGPRGFLEAGASRAFDSGVERKTHVLFSFPWIVADVIANGLCDD